ncbi:MAG: hypothetical protein CL843_09440 [Crocinitomicaceae bacterium]|nr:hypothetical protein [Crocinitomicaceae bacterium]|tara:strand:+ start:29 stop:472 length:444 start_codon:yes stop_codon:yes gene_type:complete
MAELFGDSVFNDILSSVGDVMDSFAKRDVHIEYSTVAQFSRDGRDNTNDLNVTLPAVIKWENSSDTGKSKIDKKGKIDDYDGYCLIDYAKFKDNGLVEDGAKFIIDEGNSKITVDSRICQILSIIPVGHTGDTYALIKIYFQKLIDA